MTWLQRILGVWVRAGVAVLIAAPGAMYLMFRAQGLPAETFTTTAAVRVTEPDAAIRFEPAAPRQSARWMLLPGCPADSRAYGPLARAVAAHGYVSVIVRVPYRCAPWPQHTTDLRARVIASLLLIGSTHPREDDYSDLAMPVMKIAGSEDGVAPLEASVASRSLLPASARLEVIDGANHAQFGYYGFQLFDRRARISREEQHARAVQLVVSLLQTR
jgi:pimeloyl-ACP methyl ester carboxylesterase